MMNQTWCDVRFSRKIIETKRVPIDETSEEFLHRPATSRSEKIHRFYKAGPRCEEGTRERGERRSASFMSLDLLLVHQRNKRAGIAEGHTSNPILRYFSFRISPNARS